MTLDQLVGAFATADDKLTEALTAECKRRDRSDQARRARRADPIAAQWRDAAYAQYLAASRVTNGYMTSRACTLPGGKDLFEALWTGPESVAMARASEELREFWASPGNARLTLTEYRRQLAGAARGQDDERERDAGRLPDAAALAAMIRAEPRETWPRLLDQYAPAIDEMLDMAQAACWLGIQVNSAYVAVGRGTWPCPIACSAGAARGRGARWSSTARACRAWAHRAGPGPRARPPR